MLSALTLGAQDINLNLDFKNSQIRSQRIELGLEVNPSISFNGTLKISFGTTSSSVSMTTHVVASISDQEDFTAYENNTKTYFFKQENLSPNTTYYFKWWLESSTFGNIEKQVTALTTPAPFSVLPSQKFEIPEEGLIPGDTIGFLKYDDTNGSWSKVQTAYKTTIGLKNDGTLWAWGRNAKRIIVNPASRSEVVYEPVQVIMPPDPANFDSDGDGYWDVDENLNSQSDSTTSTSVPTDTDEDMFSDAFEISLGLNPNSEEITPEEDRILYAYFIANILSSANSMLFHDFALSRTAVLAIEKDTRRLFFWGVAMGNVGLTKRSFSDHLASTSDSNILPMDFEISDLVTGWENIVDFPMEVDTLLRWERVAISNNFTSPKFPNPNGIGEVYDATAAGITEDGDLYIWGVIDGLMLPDKIQVGSGRTWKDVRVGDAIIALSTDGTIHEIGMKIPLSASLSTLDRDNDGVSDTEDAFEWDPNFQYDNDDDGFPNKMEDRVGTNKNNSDSDGDGVLDAEDQLPLDPNYSLDNDQDGLPDELDPNDDNWDSDNDGVPDGEDADPSDPNKRWDCDGDGVDDETEWQRNADPCVLDTDGDGVNDKDDKYPRSFFYKKDSDGDGLPDALEIVNETNPNNSDTDGDGYLDAIAASKFDTFRLAANNLDCSEGWERCDQWLYFWRFWDIKYDCDGNGWVSWEEWEGISPACQGLLPRDEFPNDANYTADTDRDGDPDEIDEDDDNDGFKDVVELDSNVNTDPKDWESQPKDMDGDWLADAIEISIGSDPYSWDTDGDGSGDGWDSWPLDPTIAWDDDKDRLENWIEENRLGTDPQKADTDGDGVNDNLDLFPLDANQSSDSDGDGLSDSYENAQGMNPNSKDSDGDGYYDAPCDRNKEVYYTDPETGFSWWTDNWRECDGYWARNPNNNNNWQYYPSSWVEDKFPTIANEWADNDADGTGDNSDTDDDNDGTIDSQDDFPNNPAEQKNTDKPTIANGYLTDDDNDGVYGEDYNNDGWVEETTGDRRRFDFIGNNQDLDDDGDLYLDVDEIASGTDPLDPDDFPGSTFRDQDKDGLSDGYEISTTYADGSAKLPTDPKNWDSDFDGVSDGWKYPHECGTWGSANHKIFIEIPNASATVNPDTYYIMMQGDNENYNNRTTISYTVSTSINGTQLLNHFATELNNIGQITHDTNQTQTYSATVSDNLLIITLGGTQRKFYFEAFNTVIGPNNTIYLYKHDHDSHWWKSDLYVLPATGNNINNMCEGWNLRYGLGVYKDQSNAEFDLLRDAFPNDPDEFWDTDKDGTGDKSDTDIDGDGILNSVDPMPFDPVQSLDTDGDGYLDIIDPDDDNDWKLDVDELFNSTDPLDSNSRPYADADGDALSDSYEVSIGSNPNNRDSDGDGINDGPFYYDIASGQNWNVRIDVPNASFSTIIGDEYYISLNGHNQDYNDRLLVTFNGQTSKTGTELLNYFKTELNNVGEVLHDNGRVDTFSATVSGTRLTIAGNDTSRNFHFEAFVAIPGANNKLVLAKHDWRYHWWKSEAYQQRDTNSCCWVQSYMAFSNDDPSYLMDAFPNDPNEFWDTDGDGIGDNSDTDIDGDGYTNINDKMPFDARDHLDSDNDGIGDSMDNNKDGDNFLDFDDPNPTVFTPADGGQDADNDGFSDGYERSIGTDPNDWDSDNDGVSDGWQYPQRDESVNWNITIDILSLSAKPQFGDEYKLQIEGYNNGNNRTELSYTVSSTSTPSEILQYFNTQINSLGSVQYIENGITYNESISSVVSSTKLIISGNDFNKSVHINAFSTIVNGTKLILSDDYGDWNWKSDFFAQRDPNKGHGNFYFYGEGRIQGELKGKMFIDAFPNDPNEYWDTDGDGTGDNADTDIDGDGLTNVYELTPREPKYSGAGYNLHSKSNPYMVDTDSDGVNDNLDGIPWNDRESVDFDGDFRGDENDDDDDDNDGLPDLREINLGLNTNNQDSDGDGFSDGCKGIGFKSHDADGNWIETIKVIGTVSQTIAGESYKIFIEGYNNWENRAEIKITTASSISATALLTQFANEINSNYNSIDFKDWGYDGQNTLSVEQITASVSGTSLIIKGNDARAQIHIQTWEWRGVIKIATSFCSEQNEDRFPDDKTEWYDSDWDDIGDNEDLDDDNDGLSDAKEISMGTNPYYWDTDGDHRGDDWDQMPLDINSFEDMDGDGIPDFTIVDTNNDGNYDPDIWGGPDVTTIVDQDVDGDGISNTDEDNGVTDRYQPDSDWDGYDDGVDKFPVWYEEWYDTDSDGIGNNLDRDDDGDGFSDLDEAFSETNPLDASSKPTLDQDADFMSDKYEDKIGTSPLKSDTDGDTYKDGIDHFPTNPLEWLDSDGDGQGNNEDDNDDNDHLNDFVEIKGNELNLWNLDPLVYNDFKDIPQDSDRDGLPDSYENYISALFQTTWNAASDGKKRDLYKATKGMWRPYYTWLGVIWTGNNGEQLAYDLDGDSNGTQDHLETINFYNVDGDEYLNINDRDSDQDGADDGWDQAVFDKRGQRDLDSDFISDDPDVDMDGDNLLNWWERYYGTETDNPDSDGDGVIDSYDYNGFDSRIQTKSQYTESLFSLNQIGSSNNWNKISTWNLGQIGASYAAINSNGELYVWGLNYGSLPVHDNKSLKAWENGEEYGFVISSPTRVRPNETWKDISLGFKFGIGYSTDGTFYSWGRNLSSQLGKGKPTTYETFSKPNIYLGEITQISAGDQQVGIINKDGKLRMIGSNDQGQLGTGATNDNTPQELDWDDISGDIKEVRVTETETQIITDQGSIWAYGDNLFAQLGRGTRDTKAENFEAKKIETEGWTEIYAITEHVFAFKADGTLWAWGKNKNFDLGLGFKSEYVATPTQVAGVNRSQMKEVGGFSPINGGFVYIKTNGELWGAGANFYTGSWFPLTVPRKIGKYSDWSRFHDFMNSELNIMIEKTDGSIWGAGANWNRVLTQNPCPEPRNQIEKLTITHPNQYQETVFEVGQITGNATITIKANDISLTVTNVTSSANFVNDLKTLFDADQTLTNALSLTVTPTGSGSSTLHFKSNAYQQNKYSFSITDKSTSTLFSGPISFADTVENISGTATYTINISGSRIEASADNSADAVANIKVAIETSDRIDSGSFVLTVTNTTSILIENIYNQSFFITTELQNSNTSSSSFTVTNTQAKLSIDCYPGFINDLVEIFPEGNNWKEISMGLHHVVALTDSGALYSWGANTQNQLGLGVNLGKWDIINEPRALGPVVTDSVTKTFTSVDASAEVSFAIASDNSMYAWGDNDLGTLAVGDYSDKNIPTLVKGNINWKSNLGGFRFQVALDQNDKPYGWGYRKFGQLGALGKVKGDDIVWDTDLSESKGIVQTLNGGEYLIATAELINYLDTVLNFEFNGDTSKKGTVQKPNSSTSKYSSSTKDSPNTKKLNVGKWKVKKKKTGFKGKSAIEPTGNSSLKTSDTPYDFDVVDVNEKPTSINLTDLSNKLTSKGEQFIANITVTDPDQDDIITVTVPSNSPNAGKFEIKNQKLYYNTSTSKANVPYQVIIRATDWEGLNLEAQFEVLVDEDGSLSVEEVQSSGSISYDARFIDSDGDGFVDADEIAIGTDQFDFRSFPTDIDSDGILDFYDGDIDNDGYLNEDDQFPNNPNEWIDSDGDGIPDNADNDDDNDGVYDFSVNWQENYISQDLFPNDPNESSDNDRDGIGDNADTDDDNDGVEDSQDAFPFNPNEWLDSDNDSIGNNSDEDNDNDGYSNFDEIAIGTDPLDASDFPADLDSDFIPDAIDADLDGDGIPNSFDNAPELFNPDQEFLDNQSHFALIFPDFFSPNGDGVNDTWTIGELQRYGNNQVWIYDATGNLIFSQQQYANDWGGTNNGQPLPKASYLYRVDADGNGSVDYQGWVFLTR
ncbi:gliding motility-associated C-terminal domain-containing protein [Flavobacteriaceae bacterium]|nr:gliding motility-associated C-terminal domain-containing protein [Flavobacteriaceae bacterium]MDB4255008.1 gliding motility-associated C-terminal domain-containing protein [Flavobacteriaceae bacterium]